MFVRAKYHKPRFLDINFKQKETNRYKCNSLFIHTDQFNFDLLIEFVLVGKNSTITNCNVKIIIILVNIITNIYGGLSNILVFPRDNIKPSKAAQNPIKISKKSAK